MKPDYSEPTAFTIPVLPKEKPGIYIVDKYGIVYTPKKNGRFTRWLISNLIKWKTEEGKEI